MSSNLPNKGFTLIEILVSVTIFTVVMTIAIGALITINDALQKAKLLRASIENVNIALEGMSKKIRTGSEITCLSALDVTQPFGSSGATELPRANCEALGTLNDGYGIAFFSNELGKFVAYRWGSQGDRDHIGYATSDDAHFTWENKANGSETLDVITSGEVNIQRLRFYVKGTSRFDNVQPQVTILITAIASLPGKTFLDTKFNLQTTVSQRVFDL